MGIVIDKRPQYRGEGVTWDSFSERTDAVVCWIKEKNLEDKFLVKFGV